MNDHHDILDPNSPWRVDVRRNAAAKDQNLIDEAEECGNSPMDLLNIRWMNATLIFEARTRLFAAEHEEREAQR